MNLDQKSLKHRANRRARGFSIIEVLVALGIMSIVSMALISLLTNQNKEVKALGERMISKDVETQLKNVLLNSSYCDCLLRGYTLNTVTTPTAWNSFPLSIPSGYNQPPPAAPTPCTALSSFIIPPVGGKIGNSSVKTAGITMDNILYQGSGYYTGSLNISFDPGSMVRAMKSLRIPMSFSIDTTSGTPAARNFSSCGSAPSASGFVFLDPPVILSNTATGIANSGWITQNLGSLVPSGTTTIIIETYLKNIWRVSGTSAKFRKNSGVSAAGELWLGVTEDNDSAGSTAEQGFYPIDTVSNSFQYRVDIAGDGGTWEIRLIGYVAP